MKRLISIICIMALTVSMLGACNSKKKNENSGNSGNNVTQGAQNGAGNNSNSGNNTDSGNNSGGEKEGKITIFQSKTEIMSELNALAKAFTAETGIEVEVWETTGDSYYSDLKTGLSTESGATIFSLQPGAESTEMSDYLEDLSGLSFIDKIGEGMADVIDGKTVGIPYTVEGFGMVYNSNLIDVSELTDTDELIAFLKSCKSSGIPTSLEEAATIDGCTPGGVFFKIVFPILKPTTMTVIILDVIWIWNDYLLPSLTLKSVANRTIPISTAKFFGQYTISWNEAMAALVITIVPVALFYLTCQKYIVKGVAAGAVKG